MLKKTILAFFATLFFTFPVLGQEFNKASIENYITRFKSLAMEEQVRTGIPAAITLAQGICETGAGTSELCTNAHNHFGIKCKGNWTGETYSYDDDQPSECFRKYDNPLQSFKDHSNFLKNNTRYARLFQLKPTDYKGWAEGLKACGYATNKHYAKKLIGYIEQYNLEQYTEQALSGKVLPNIPPAIDNPDTDLLADSDDEDITLPAVSKKLQATVSAAAYPSSAGSEGKQVAYYVTTQKNGLKGFYARKGDLLLEYAITHHVRYGKLLAINDLPDEPIEADMFIYLEKKRKYGLQAYFEVKPGMDLSQVSQETGVALEQLRLLNHLKNGEEPAPGVLLALKEPQAKNIQIVQDNTRKSTEEDQNKIAVVPVNSPVVQDVANPQKENKAQPEYIYINHKTTKNESKGNAEIKADTMNEGQLAPVVTDQKELAKAIPLPIASSVKQQTQEAASQESKEVAAPQKELSQTEKLRAMMDKIVYGHS